MIHYFSDKILDMPLDWTGKILLLIEKNGSRITFIFNILLQVSTIDYLQWQLKWVLRVMSSETIYELTSSNLWSLISQQHYTLLVYPKQSQRDAPLRWQMSVPMRVKQLWRLQTQPLIQEHLQKNISYSYKNKQHGIEDVKNI